MSLFTLLRHRLGMLLRRPQLLTVGTQAPDFTVTAPEGRAGLRTITRTDVGSRMNIRLVVEPQASDALKNVVRERLDIHNVAATGAAEYYPVCFFLKNDHDEILGGLLGNIWARCMHIATLWVAPILRQQGYGTALMHAAEGLARERACTLVYLETFSFQAPLFYARLGYETIAVLQDCPTGHQKHFLKKSL